MTETALFPAFERFAAEDRRLASPKGILSARLPRILGQGKTRAEGLELPPAAIERQQELVALTLPDGMEFPAEVRREIAEAQAAVTAHAERMRQPDHRRRFALEVLHKLGDVPKGNRDNQFFAGRLVLAHDKSGQNWAWSITPHYPVIAKLPADAELVVQAHAAAERIVDERAMPVEQFLDRLRLAWTLARHFSRSDDVLIADVARLFKIAAQDERFWATPARRNFADLPDASFIINLISWRRAREAGARDPFELVPATLNQAHGAKSRAYFVPANNEGTAVRPMIYMRMRQDGRE